MLIAKTPLTKTPLTKTPLVIPTKINKKNMLKKQITKSTLEPYQLAAKSISLFTFFYCSFNWYYYRKVREHQEQSDDSK
tara:strand:- start:19637 stop:19873 length:237 start_codon:yes stop_codon:yes gene_type:complete